MLANSKPRSRLNFGTTFLMKRCAQAPVSRASASLAAGVRAAASSVRRLLSASLRVLPPESVTPPFW